MLENQISIEGKARKRTIKNPKEEIEIHGMLEKTFFFIYFMNRPFLSLFRDAIEKGLLLIIATVAAIIFANSEASSIYHNIVYTDFEFIYNNKSFSLPLHFIINDVLMSVFFLAVGIEIKKERDVQYNIKELWMIMQLMSVSCENYIIN